MKRVVQNVKFRSNDLYNFGAGDDSQIILRVNVSFVILCIQCVYCPICTHAYDRLCTILLYPQNATVTM